LFFAQYKVSTENHIETEDVGSKSANPNQTDKIIKRLLPNSSDVIICYSTLEGMSNSYIEDV